MDSIAPALGSLLVFAYLIGVIWVIVYVVLLVRRHVLAQERIAVAVERIAQRSPDPGASTTHPGVDASA